MAGVLRCAIACFVPYKGLINVLYGINRYLGFVLVFFMIVYGIKTGMSRHIRAEKNLTECIIGLSVWQDRRIERR
jgi:uncharacterized membrane protein YkvI